MDYSESRGSDVLADVGNFDIPRSHAMMVLQEFGMTRALLVATVCLGWISSLAQAPPPVTVAHQDQSTVSPAQSKPRDPSTDISGTYSFLREGEFVDLSVDDGQLSGFISRFGLTDSDKDQFIDHFLDKASLQGDHVTFKTKTVHAVWYEFDGTIATVPGKQPGEEGYRLLAGKLTMYKADVIGKEQASVRTVEFKSFPDSKHIRK